jgi:hypothetical protein
MNKLAAVPPVFVGAALLWAAPGPRVPVPEYEPLAEAMRLDFRVQAIEGRNLELGLRGGDARGPLFLQFEVGTEGGATVVTLNGAGNRSAGRGRAPGDDLPDWAFLTGRDGERVLDFSFENQLVELPDGQTAVRMTYVGPPVPLLRSLRVARPTTLPPFVARELGHSGPLQLEAGSYPIDTEGAATVRARLLGGGA